MRVSIVRPAALAAALLLSLAPRVPAQGRILPPPCAVPVRPEGVRPPCRSWSASVQRLRSDVRVELDDRVLRYEVRETFVNRGGAVAEADYVFPLPRGAAFQELQLQIGEEMVSGEVLDAGEARRVYEEIVRRQRDPALVEWMGGGLLRARIFPLAPGEEKRVVVRFATVAEREGDVLRVDYAAGSDPSTAGGGWVVEPLTRDDVSDDARRRVPTRDDRPSRATVRTFTLRYPDAERFGRPYSPTHMLDVRERGERREARVRGDGGDVTILLPVRGTRDAAIGVLAYRPNADEDGFALVTVTPPALRGRATPRDVTFVIDVSGSMGGDKLAQAKAAGRQLLATLDDDDRFRVIAFSTDVRHFARGFTPATRDRRAAAARWLDALDATGSTNISGALDEALDVPNTTGRLPLVLFLTDGAPTVGERDPDAIAHEAATLRGRARVFTFGVGRDVNAALLEQLALEGRGTAHFVRPEEDVERAVSLVASRLTQPVATDLRVTAEGVRLLQPQPQGAQDLFAGQDLVVLARYRGAGPATVRVEGMTPDGPVRWTTRVELPRREREHAYVARLWATQRLGWLAAERRRNGPSRELDEEIRMLGIRYGIPTELSSYLVLEPGMVASAAGQSSAVRRRTTMMDAAANGSVPPPAPAPPPPPPSAERDFAAAKMAAEQRAAVSLSQVVVTAAGGATASEAPTRVVGGRTFRLVGEVWTDAAWTDTLPAVRVRPYSAAYFRLLELVPELAEPLALGERVRVAGRRVAVEVSPEAPERVDEATLARVRRGW